MALFDNVKLALRRAETTAYDVEIRALIGAACSDLELAGVVTKPFSSASSYAAGDRVVHGGEYFVCTTPTTAGEEFDVTQWQPDFLLQRAVVTYCKVHFGETDEWDHLKPSYDEQKAQLMMATPYTNFGDYAGIKTALGGSNV